VRPPLRSTSRTRNCTWRPGSRATAVWPKPVWRQFTPYGAPRGAAPGTWPDTNGYLGDPVNAADGLTTIGARQYNPITGRFLTPDPVFEAGDPTQMGGYAYAADNPVTNSDPTGRIAVGPSGSSCSTGTEYISWCAGSGSDGGINGDSGTSSGTASGTASPTNPGSPRHHRPDFAVALAHQIADGQLSGTGDWVDTLAGLGSVPAGLGDVALCVSNLAECGQLAVSGEMPSALYANWMQRHRIDTSSTAYANGAAFGTLLLAFAGGPGEGVGVATDGSEETVPVLMYPGSLCLRRLRIWRDT
jgi:RHS repeat-associated protein